MQRFGRKAVYIVIGDGVEEEQGAKKVLLPRGFPACAGSGLPGPVRGSSASRCWLGPPPGPWRPVRSHLHIAEAS